MKFDQYWEVSGASRFDITGNAFVSGAVALKYDDECFAISLSYTNTRETYSDLDADQTIKLQFDFKTLGGGGISRSLDND